MHNRFFEGGRLWQLGPDWPGQRCGAKTRSGAPCKNPAVNGKGRCRMHGGRSTGAKTPEGRARLSALHWKHGRSTTKAKAEAKRRAQIGREVRAELREIERELVAGGLLAKDWRDQFEPKPAKRLDDTSLSRMSRSATVDNFSQKTANTTG